MRSASSVSNWRSISSSCTSLWALLYHEEKGRGREKKDPKACYFWGFFFRSFDSRWKTFIHAAGAVYLQRWWKVAQERKSSCNEGWNRAVHGNYRGVGGTPPECNIMLRSFMGADITTNANVSFARFRDFFSSFHPAWSSAAARWVRLPSLAPSCMNQTTSPLIKVIFFNQI